MKYLQVKCWVAYYLNVGTDIPQIAQTIQAFLAG